MTDYQAVGLAEGFVEGTFEEQIEAWAYLIKTRLAYQLQGYFGRQANYLIESGYIDKNGVIDWDTINGII